MSNTYYETEKVVLTAFVGKKEMRPATQLTLISNKSYIELSPAEAFELAMNLLFRISNFDSVTATGYEKGIFLTNKKEVN